MMKKHSLSLIAMSGALAIACTENISRPTVVSSPSAGTTEAPVPTITKLVVYSGRGEGLVGSVLQDFDKANSDIELDVRYNKTPALANQVIAEGKQCPADVLWFQDSGYLSALGDRLLPLPPALTSTIDQRFLAGDKRWLGITGRLRVLVYNTDLVKADELPKSLAELAESKWKGKLGWAPGNASLHAHVSALRHLWGEDKTEEWLKGVKANEPLRFPKNSPQVKAAHAGEISIGWVNHYYLHKLKTDGFKAANYSFPSENDAGNLLMLSGAAIRSNSKNVAAATRLLEYLVSKKVQTYFSQKRFEYPTKPNIATHPDVTPLDQLKLAKINQKQLSDVSKSIALINKLGIE
jgi:iron(III) transport system substrate-binding protein